MSRLAAVFAAAVLVLALPANAQPDEDATARLVSFSPWAAPDTPLSVAIEVVNGGATPLEDLEIGLTIRDRVRSRSSLRATLDGNPSGDVLAGTTEAYAQPVAAGQRVTISIQRDLGSLASAFRAGSATSGVYPLEMRVRAGGSEVSRRSSAFVFLATTPEKRLNLSWIVPIHRPLAADGRGTYDRAVIEREVAAVSKLRAMADVLAAHPSVPLTLAPSGVVAHELLDVADGFIARKGKDTTAIPNTDPVASAAANLLAAFRTAVAAPAFEVASTTYGRASMARLVASGLAADANRQIRVAREVVQAAFGRAPDPALFVDGILRVDAGSARTVAALGATTLILDPAALRDRPEGRFGPDVVEEVRASRLRFAGVLVDAPIRERLETPSDDRILTAMGVLAETAAAYFERPAGADGRLLVIGTASMPEPAVARTLIDALSAAPWLSMRTASAAAADPLVQSADEPRRLGTVEGETSTRVQTARAARRSIQTFESILVKPSGADAVTRLERTLLASESADYDRRQGTAVALGRAAGDRALASLRKITVPKRQVTLTRQGGEVPVTIQNRTGFAIRLLVELDSPKLAFPAGRAKRLDVEGRPGGRSLGTLVFRVEARGAGSFPIAVNLKAPDGQAIVGTGEVQVRSSAVSAVTLMATAGGALFLVVAWARRAISRRSKPAANA